MLFKLNSFEISISPFVFLQGEEQTLIPDWVPTWALWVFSQTQPNLSQKDNSIYFTSLEIVMHRVELKCLTNFVKLFKFAKYSFSYYLFRWMKSLQFLWLVVPCLTSRMHIILLIVECGCIPGCFLIYLTDA